MKNKMYYLFPILFAGWIFSSCDKDVAVNEPPPPAPQAQNLIQNPSFENGGQFSLQGWKSCNGVPEDGWYSIDTSWNWYSAIKDAPSGGGNWSLEIFNGFQSNINDAVYFITNQSGTGIYQLSVYAKAMLWGSYYSRICLQKNPLNSNYAYPPADPMDCKCINLADTSKQWKKYVLTDTITTLPIDTIFVELVTQGAGPVSEKVCFDLIEVIKIEP